MPFGAGVCNLAGGAIWCRRGSPMHYLFHAAHVARHGGIFTLAGALIGFLLAAPLQWAEIPCRAPLQAMTCGHTFKNIFGTSGSYIDGFVGPMIFVGAVVGFLGFLLGKFVVAQGWMSEDEVH